MSRVRWGEQGVKGYINNSLGNASSSDVCVGRLEDMMAIHGLCV